MARYRHSSWRVDTGDASDRPCFGLLSNGNLDADDVPEEGSPQLHAVLKQSLGRLCTAPDRVLARLLLHSHACV